MADGSRILNAGEVLNAISKKEKKLRPAAKKEVAVKSKPWLDIFFDLSTFYFEVESCI